MELDLNVVMESFGFDPVLEEAAQAEAEGGSASEALEAACAADVELEKIVPAAPGEVAAATARAHARQSPSGGRSEANPSNAKWAVNLLAKYAGWCGDNDDYSARSSGPATQAELEGEGASARSAEFLVIGRHPVVSAFNIEGHSPSEASARHRVLAIESGSPLDNDGTLPRAPYTGAEYVAADEAMARQP